MISTPPDSPYLLRLQALVLPQEKTLYQYKERKKWSRHKCSCEGTVPEYDCGRHWQDFSEERFQEITLAIDPDQKYYVGRFNHEDIYEQDKVAEVFRKFTSSVSHNYRHSYFVWVNHLVGCYVHRHYLFGFPHEVNVEFIKHKYRKFHSKYCSQPLGPMGIMCEPCTSPTGWTRYILGIDYKKNPKMHMPWRDYTHMACLLPNVCDGSMVYRHHLAMQTTTPQ